jgi:hypothetical protein
MFAAAMILTMTAEDSSCVNSTNEGAGTMVTHTCHKAVRCERKAGISLGKCYHWKVGHDMQQPAQTPESTVPC